MKIVVCVKQVPDTTAKISVKSDTSGIEEVGFKWVMNPYDEFAVEEALQIKQKNPSASVHIITLGPKARAVECLRTALAMGAETATVVDSNQTLDNILTAKALAKAIEKDGGADLVLTGKLAIDDSQSAVTQMLAEFLGFTHTNVVSKLNLDSAKALVEREVEGGTKEVVELSTPCVLGANKGLNTPRYASLPGIMKAKKKPVTEYTLADLGLSETDIKISYSDFEPPKDREPVKMIAGETGAQVSELVSKLREEAKVI